jgi:hypothetical protein
MRRRVRSAALASVALCLGIGSAAPAQLSRVGGEFRANSYTPGDQNRPKVGVSSSGSFVVVWTGPDSSYNGVFARRFGANGVAQGLDFQVNTYTFARQYGRAVGVDAEGDFVVVWTSALQDSVGYGIFARRFNSAGTAQGFDFQVSTYTDSNGFDAAIAMKPDGAFVVAWSDSGRDGSLYGVFARRFDSAGTPQGGDIAVNTYTFDDQREPSVGIDGDGGFVVTWTDEGGHGGMARSVFARRFGSSGAPITGEIQVATFTHESHLSEVSMNSDGDFVVAWQRLLAADLDVFARRFSAAGVAVGGEFAVNTYTSFFQSGPVPTMADDGAFVITWLSDLLDGSGSGVFARRYDAAGLAETGREFQVNSYTPGDQDSSVVAGEPSGDLVVAWKSAAQDGSSNGIFAQRFQVPKPFDIDGNGTIDALTDGLLFLRYAFGFRGAALVTSAVALNCTRCTPALVADHIASLTTTSSASPAGVEFQVNAYTEDEERRPSVAADDDGDFVVAWHSPHDGSSEGVFMRRFASSGAVLSGEVEVNTYVTGAQAFPSVDLDADGDFVVVWQSYQDGSETGIFAQRFSSAGSRLGAELRVNNHTPGFQIAPAVAVDGDGDFVVAWSSKDQDGDDYGVFGRRFNSAGVAQAVEFQVSTYTQYDQYRPVVASSAAGAFVVAWASEQDGSSYGVFGRRFNSAGTPIGVEFPVNTHTNNTQAMARVAINDGGAFVVVWNSPHDGNYYGVFGQRFDAAGLRQGVEFQVNTRTTGGQSVPAVDIESSGEFLVSWASYGQDGNGSGVFARRFGAAGLPLAAEFQVNTVAADEQTAPAVALSEGPTLVIAWQSNAQDGTAYGVFARRFFERTAADVDGDGAVAPLTDGLLFLRYAFGFRGAALIGGAVGPKCTRCTAPAIEAYISSKV